MVASFPASADGAAPAEEAGDREPLLVFRVAGIWLAVPAATVDEIVDDRPPTPLPMAPPHLPGVVLVRGEVVALLGLERFLDLEAPSGGDDDEGFRRIVLVESGGLRAGLRSERIRGVRAVARSRLQRPDSLPGGRLREHSRAQVDLEGLGLAAVLDLEGLLQAARGGAA